MTVVANGRWFDGVDVVDASGCWVIPGIIDIHTHYDAEVLAAPALTSHCGTASHRS